MVSVIESYSYKQLWLTELYLNYEIKNNKCKEKSIKCLSDTLSRRISFSLETSQGLRKTIYVVHVSARTINWRRRAFTYFYWMDTIVKSSQKKLYHNWCYSQIIS